MPKRPRRFKWHAFMCHASEDKKVVLSLHEELKKYGLEIWLDKFSLKVGDSLRRAVERGLTRSRFGIVVFSPSFFAKQFPQSELDGLFTREMEGKKVILPVWHKIDAETMRKFVPMLADKWAAMTSGGIPTVARQLVQIIKPKALELEARRADAQGKNTHYIKMLQEKNPTVKFQVFSGEGISPKGVTPNPGTIASIFYQPDMRVDVLPRDPKKYQLSPVTVSVRLSPNGLAKFQEMLRTGRSQELTGKEFTDFKTSLDVGALPVASKGKRKRKLVLKSPPIKKRTPIRVKFGSGTNPIVIPYMEMEVERAGTDEGAFIAQTKDTYLSLRFFVRFKPPSEGTIEIKTTLKGVDIHTVQKYNRAITALQESGELEIYSIEADSILLETKCSIEKPNAQEVRLREFIDDIARVADYFGVKARWPQKIEDSDFETLALLLRTISGKPIAGPGATINALMVKSPESLAAFDMLKSEGRLLVIRGEALPFFGGQIESSTLAYYAEGMRAKDFEATRRRLEMCATGETIEVAYETTSPMFLRLWDKAQSRFKENPST